MKGDNRGFKRIQRPPDRGGWHRCRTLEVCPLCASERILERGEGDGRDLMCPACGRMAPQWQWYTGGAA